MAKLVFSLDDGQVITVAVAGHMTVGSAEGNDVLVEDASIAAQHAEILPTEDGGFCLKDLGSTSGTKVNGDRITSRDLRHGDELAFGALRGRFVSETSPAAPTTRSAEGPSPPAPPASPVPKDASASAATTPAAPATPAPNAGREKVAEARLKELTAAYSDLHGKHQLVHGLISQLGAQEKQKLASLERMTVEMIALEGRIAEARESLQKGEEALSNTTESLKQAQDANAELRRETEQLTATRDQLKGDVATLEGLRSEAEAAYRRSESALLDAASAHEEKQRLHTKLQDEHAQLEVQHAGLHTDFNELNQRKTDTEAALLAHQSDLEALRAELAALAQQRTEAETQTAALQAEQERLTASTADLAEKERLLHQVTSEHHSLKLEVASVLGLLASTKDEHHSLTVQTTELADEREKLTASVAEVRETLQRATADAARQREEHSALIEQHQGTLRSLTADIGASQSAHEELGQRIAEDTSKHGELDLALQALTATTAARTEEIATLSGQRDALTDKIQELSTARTEAEARTAEFQTIAAEWEAHIHRFAAEFHELEAKHAALDISVAKLQGTEDQLLKAKRLLDETTASHSAISTALVALDSRHKERTSQVAGLERTVDALATDTEKARADLAHEEEQLANLRRTGEETKAALRAEQSAQEAKLKATKADLSTATEQLRQAKATHDELQRENQKLDSVRADIRRAEENLTQLGERTLRIQSDAAALEATLAKLRDETQSTTSKLESLRAEKDTLSQNIAQLTEKERFERTRFEELRELNRDTERTGIAQKAALTAELEAKRLEMLQVERKLLDICVSRDDLEQRYALLATMPENSPDALKLWREIQQLKLDAAEKLPGGIKSRFNTHTQVVPKRR